MDRNNESVKPAATEPSLVMDEKPALVDSAALFLHSETIQTTYAAEEEQALVRKVDWLILPLMGTVYCLQYIDKTLINFANIMGLTQDTNTTSSQFSYLALAFYASYLVCEPLTGFLLQKLPVAKYLGVNVILWGTCVALNCVCKNYASLLVLRILLGCFEACVSPSLILITCMWYKRQEQPARVGIWYVTLGFGTIIGALCSFGLQHYHGTVFKSWQILFLVFGVLTVAVGVLIVIFLPDNPMSSRLTHREKIIAIERLRGDTTGIENKTFKPDQFFETLKDPHTWLICLVAISCNVPNGAVSTFQAAIIQSFGFSAQQAALLSIPSGVIAIIGISSSSYLSFKFKIRSLIIVSVLVPGIIGGALMAFLPTQNRIGRLMGNYLTNTVGCSTPLLYSWVAANFAGHTKKVTIYALLLMAVCLGNIIGPLTFTGATAPDYIPAKIAIVATLALAVSAALVLAATYRRENTKRNRGRSEAIDRYAGDSSFLDLTDRQNKEFRYIL